MDDDQLDDLKQFIANTVSQTEQRLRDELASKEDIAALRLEMDDKFKSVRLEMSDGFTGVGEAIEEVHHVIDELAKSTDRRLTRLEKQAA